jgi:hypothetical protein
VRTLVNSLPPNDHDVVACGQLYPCMVYNVLVDIVQWDVGQPDG